MNRETIFISHATPEDNDFTIWLASRLRMLGYEVWIDKTGLVGGEKFWEDIDNVIRNKAIKYLVVYSKSICQKDETDNAIIGKLKDGISKEYALAESIGKQNKINDFIILMNIDASEYNLFIDAPRLNQIPFYENWAEGLKQLEKKLIKDEIPKPNVAGDDGFGEWYEKQFAIPNGITEKRELYYTNWWSIKKLPDYFFIYQFRNKEQADTIVKQNITYPLSKISNCISSFEEKNVFLVKTQEEDIEIVSQEIFKIKITDVLIGYESNEFPTHRDASNHFKQLLKKVFHQIMKNRGMFWYEMANKRFAYYYTPANLTSLKVKFEYPFRNKNKFKTKNLIGKHKDLGKWHFAVSIKPILFPVLGYSLKSHITFTEDGFKIWKNEKGEPDSERIHSQRRAKGKRMFNEEWRDEFLAFISALKKENKIEIALNPNFKLEMPSMPELYWADFGYFDPKDKSRHGLLSTYEFEEEVMEETEII